MKYCDKCGAQITEGMTNCPSCGVAVVAPVAPAPVEPAPAQAIETAAAPTPVVVEAAPTPVEMPAPAVAAPAPVEPAVAPAPVAPAPVAEPAPVQPAVAPAPAAPAAPVMAQPVYAQPVVAPVVAQPKKSGGVPVVLVILLLLVTTGVGLVLGKVIFGGTPKQPEITVNDHSSDEKEEENEKEDEEYDDVAQLNAKTEAYISGHKLTIPSEYNFEVDDEDVLYVYDDTQEWISEIMLTQFIYSNITSNINTIINNFKTSGITVEGYEEKVISGLDLIEIKLVDPSGIKILAAYVKVSDAYVAVLSVYNQTSGEYESGRFADAVEILATAERSSTSRDTAANKNNALIAALPQA